MYRFQEVILLLNDIRIGRDPVSDIVIEAKEVSRSHVVIVQKAGHYILYDQGSTKGIYVNNLKLDKAVSSVGTSSRLSCIFQFLSGPPQSTQH